MVPETRVTRRALDGRRFVLGGPFDFGGPFTSTVEISVNGRRHELTAGLAELGDAVAEALGIPGFDEEYTHQGGTLQIARTQPYDAGIRLREDRLTAVWRGRRYGLVTQMYRADTTALLSVLRTLWISEHDDGLELSPGSGSSFATPATLTGRVPGLGLLEISPLTAQHATQLPRWRGLATQAGELFRDTLTDGSPYFVLVTGQTWITVLPLHDTALDRVPEMVGRLRLHPAA
jgi:hypothetical protein